MKKQWKDIWEEVFQGFSIEILFPTAAISYILFFMLRQLTLMAALIFPAILFILLFVHVLLNVVCDLSHDYKKRGIILFLLRVGVLVLIFLPMAALSFHPIRNFIGQNRNPTPRHLPTRERWKPGR